MKLRPIAILLLSAIAPSLAFSADELASRGTEKAFLETQNIDGYQITFQVLPAQAGKEMGGSHDLMVKIEKAGELVTDALVNTKVIQPDGEAEGRATTKMGDWYRTGYDLGRAGRHHVLLLFQAADGSWHSADVFYPE